VVRCEAGARVFVLLVLCIGSGIVPAARSQGNQAGPSPRVIRASATPREGVLRLQMHELWHTDPDAPEYLFGFIDAAVADKEGRVYLLDRQVGDVKVFSPDGRFLRTVSGRGEGPGETQTPRGLVLDTGGGIGVFEEFPARIAWLDRDGNGAGSWAPKFAESSGPPLVAFKQVLVGGTRTYVSYGRLFLTAKEELSALAAFDGDGDLLVTYLEKRHQATSPGDVDLEYRGFNRGQWDVDARGRLYALVDTGDYRIAAHDSSGAVTFILERDFPRRKRTTDEIDRLRETFMAEEYKQPGTTAESAPAIHMLHLAQNGELWVVTDPPEAALKKAAGAKGPIAALCDVFSSEGEYLREVVIPGDVDWDRDKWIWISDERVIVLRDRASALAAEQAALRRASARAGGRAEEAETDPGEGMTVVCFALVAGS
jgi:hypothetical protein